ncbi:MAG TPA: ActS/PrrB/RegB family redox-sensitive histidine kinase [Beijerinckiaceae bacterium]|jgi:two-component system sensor histidine kinase RegB|nr:ActS/PrrB/RegB family redox-sensitive histidine kinase [Beijerinckiaceae bacterium]
MPDLSDIDLGSHARRLRVDTLVRLRWLAIAGQSAAVLGTYFGLGFNLPIGPCLLAIAVSAALNLTLRLRLSRTHRLADGPAAALLAFDILQLSALLFLTGGIENPFVMLFLAPVMISAVSLPGRLTLALAALMIACATGLTVEHMPLPWYDSEHLALPLLYRVSIWVALVLGAAFIGIYAARVAEEARRLGDALTATELVLAREQHLTQLDGLAAAAAHELGTPLATIALVTAELRKQTPQNVSMKDDLALLAQEIARCRTILGKLTSLSEESDGVFDRMKLGQLIEEVVDPQRHFGVEVKVSQNGEGPEPVCLRNPGLMYGLGNLVENAIDFARSEVCIQASWSAQAVTVTIEDDGPGFAPDVLAHLGEPYFTTRADRRSKIEEGSGLGLGLFIAKTLLERSGASVKMANAEVPNTGARITVRWSRELFERGRLATSSRTQRREEVTGQAA